jgi:hypothetical protein
MNATEPVVDESTQETPSSVLTGFDRCDSCGAQAYVQVLFERGELLFCGHHWHGYKDKLPASAVKVVDETHRLTS